MRGTIFPVTAMNPGTPSAAIIAAWCSIACSAHARLTLAASRLSARLNRSTTSAGSSSAPRLLTCSASATSHRRFSSCMLYITATRIRSETTSVRSASSSLTYVNRISARKVSGGRCEKSTTSSWNSGGHRAKAILCAWNSSLCVRNVMSLTSGLLKCCSRYASGVGGRGASSGGTFSATFCSSTCSAWHASASLCSYASGRGCFAGVPGMSARSRMGSPSFLMNTSRSSSPCASSTRCASATAMRAASGASGSVVIR
mmetsp:Transcript_10990/g.46183  ORF Transcript_10990/g.46183 Transcript_10990/m.46183 type:complete len:258 (+) Transcript_10990:1564-2337(+)